MGCQWCVHSPELAPDTTSHSSTSLSLSRCLRGLVGAALAVLVARSKDEDRCGTVRIKNSISKALDLLLTSYTLVLRVCLPNQLIDNARTLSYIRPPSHSHYEMLRTQYKESLPAPPKSPVQVLQPHFTHVISGTLLHKLPREDCPDRSMDSRSIGRLHSVVTLNLPDYQGVPRQHRAAQCRRGHESCLPRSQAAATRVPSIRPITATQSLNISQSISLKLTFTRSTNSTRVVQMTYPLYHE